MTVATRVSTDDDLRQQGVRIVRPEEAVDVIRDYVRENLVTRFYGWTVPPGLPPEWSDEHVELTAREVIPEVRRAR
jgi:hypothetical protein